MGRLSHWGRCPHPGHPKSSLHFSAPSLSCVLSLCLGWLLPPSLKQSKSVLLPSRNTHILSRNLCPTSPQLPPRRLPSRPGLFEQAVPARFLYCLACPQGWTRPCAGHQQPPAARTGGHWSVLVPPTCLLTGDPLPRSPLASRPCSRFPPLPFGVSSDFPSSSPDASGIGSLRTHPQTHFCSCVLTHSPVLWPRLPASARTPRAAASEGLSTHLPVPLHKSSLDVLETLPSDCLGLNSIFFPTCFFVGIPSTENKIVHFSQGVAYLVSALCTC